MAIRITAFAVGFGAAAVVGVAVSVASSPWVRDRAECAGEWLSSMADRSVTRYQSQRPTRFRRRMAALEEMSETLDSATTQYGASMMACKAAAALAQEPRLRGLNLDVCVIGGVLHLEGEVREEEDIDLAGRVARQVSGAELVANDLKVASPTG